MERIEAAREFTASVASGDEEPVGNELVQVFPVQTMLSRLASYDSDCVVKVLPQIVEQPQRELRGAIRASISKYVPQVKAKSKRKLLFLIAYHTDASDTVAWLQEEGFSQMARQLGYETASGSFAEYGFLLKK